MHVFYYPTKSIFKRLLWLKELWGSICAWPQPLGAAWLATAGAGDTQEAHRNEGFKRKLWQWASGKSAETFGPEAPGTVESTSKHQSRRRIYEADGSNVISPGD